MEYKLNDVHIKFFTSLIIKQLNSLYLLSECKFNIASGSLSIKFPDVNIPDNSENALTIVSFVLEKHHNGKKEKTPVKILIHPYHITAENLPDMDLTALYVSYMKQAFSQPYMMDYVNYYADIKAKVRSSAYNNFQHTLIKIDNDFNEKLNYLFSATQLMK